MYDLEYNGVKASSLGIFVKNRINIPAPQPKYTEENVQGKDGAMFEVETFYNDISIKVQFNYVSKQEDWHGMFREAKKWLYSKGNARLILSDNEKYYFVVKRIEIEPNERISERIGNFAVTFICDPYQYMFEGEQEYAISDVMNNPYSICHPIYVHYAHSYGGIDSITVNGKTFSVGSGLRYYIDTEKMITYTDSAIHNSGATGDYTDLYLQEGENTITVSNSAGFTPKFKVIPRWRVL